MHESVGLQLTQSAGQPRIVFHERSIVIWRKEALGDEEKEQKQVIAGLRQAMAGADA
jgi:hypothetical protein